MLPVSGMRSEEISTNQVIAQHLTHDVEKELELSVMDEAPR